MKLETDAVFTAFEDALALIADDAERERFRLLLAASREHVRRAVEDVVRRVADEVNAAAAGLIHAQLVYGADGMELRVDRRSPGDTAEQEFDFSFVSDEIERLTLRIPTELKDIASSAADQAGVSLNAWLTGLLTREAAHRARVDEQRERGQARPRRRGPGQGLKGWVGD